MEVAGEPRWWSAKLTPRHDPSGAFTGATLVSRDITVRKHAEAERVLLAEKQARNLIATPSQLTLADLFDIDELQRIQDAFSAATGVASIITGPDGRPITRPSNFCHLCQLIRRTETDFALAECLGDGCTCRIQAPCRLKGIFHEALAALFLVLDGYTLADLLDNPEALNRAVAANP